MPRFWSILAFFLTSLAVPSAFSQTPEPGDVLWVNPLNTPADLSGSDGNGTIESLNGRTALRINLNNASTSSLRTFQLPVESLRGKWIFLTASFKADNVSPKQLDWNGLKIMLKVERPSGDQWPQISIPTGTFDWTSGSTRVLIPADATGVTLFLGLELVTGTAYFDDIRITLSRNVRDVPAAPANQPVFRGHSLPALRGAMAHPRMTREDMRVFAQEWNGNVIRWQFVRFPDPAIANDLALYDQWLEEELTYLDLVLGWAKELGVMIVIDLHSPPGGRVGSGGMQSGIGHFWSTPVSQQHFLTVWERITQRYIGHPIIWGFDLLNEPDDREISAAGVDWQTLALRAANAIRAIDPARTLIVEPNMWGSAEGFIGFEPIDLPNIVYSFHVYTPFTYTHQSLDAPSAPIPYPGIIDGEFWDKAKLEASMAPAIAFAEKYRVQMYVGEFSAIRWAPGADQYLRDLVEIFEARRWDWSYHAFREWHGWNLELGTDRNNTTPDASPNPRLQAILGKTKLNARPRTVTSKIFPADSVIDITKPPYNAQPDDAIDDTVAIQQAITDVVDVTDTSRFIYFPKGTYLVSDTLVSKNTAGIWRAMVTLQGEDRERTIIRLIDNATGFGNATTPKAILMTGSIMDAGEPDTGGGGNKAFRNNVMDLTIDTGSGNPGCIGIAWAASNWGTIKDVTIRSGDGHGHSGLSMRRQIPGPGYVKRVAIEGFDYGIDVSDIQYGFTVEHVHLRDQKIAGIRLDRNLLHIRKLTSDNTVPAIVTTHSESALTLTDSHFRGTATGNHALQTGGNLFAQNLILDPPATVRIRSQTRAANPEIPIASDPPAISSDPSPSLQTGPTLPVEDAPDFWNDNLADWAAVGPRQPGETDDTAAIQRAIDSGKSTVYLPINRTYFVSDTLVIRGAIRQFLGMGSEISLGAAQQPFGNPASPRPLFRIENTTHPEVFFEHLFLNTQYPGVIIFDNNSPKTVVIRHSGGWIGSGMHKRSYRNTSNATGKLFIEDVFMPGWDFSNQTVWARQLNPENQEGDGIVPQVRNSGGKLWILGFKSEGQAPFIVTENHAETELLGAYHYISATFPPSVPQTSIPYLVKDSRAFLSFTTENFRDNDYAVYIRTQSGDHIRDWTRSQMPPRNGAQGYRSFAVPSFHWSHATFDTWLKRHFTPAQQLDPAIVSPTADPAGDGMANLLKYHLGIDPWQRSSGFISEMIPDPSGNQFSLRYSRSKSAVDSADRFEWSTSLRSDDWHTDGISETPLDTIGDLEQIEISIPKQNRERLFLRLKVEER